MPAATAVIVALLVTLALSITKGSFITIGRRKHSEVMPRVTGGPGPATVRGALPLRAKKRRCARAVAARAHRHQPNSRISPRYFSDSM